MNTLTDWSHQPIASLSECEVHWLFAPGSLTVKLKALGRYSLDLIDQRESLASAQETSQLNVPAGSLIWIREVLMRIDDRPCVTARSIAPTSALQDDWIALADYGAHPLGDILYHDATVARSPFECAILAQGDPLEVISGRFAKTDAPLRARRSRFLRNGSPLLISECFLPEFWKVYAEQGLTRA